MGRKRSTGEPISSEGCWEQGEGEGLQLTWDPGANLVATTAASSLQRPPGASLGTWRTEKESTLDETYSGIQPSCPVESKFKNCINKCYKEVASCYKEVYTARVPFQNS